MGSLDLVKVTFSLTTNNYDSDYGFRGIGTDYAVIQAGQIVKGIGDVQYSMSYFGKLYIDTSNHFAQGSINSNGVSQPYYDYDDTVLFSFGEGGVASPVSIPYSGCTPGYNSEGGDTEETTRIVLKERGRIFCEDLGNVSNKDMDYNDVVFDAWIYVRRYYQGGTPVTLGVDSNGDNIYKEDHYKTFIQPLAAGGTLPLNIGNMTSEIHSVFVVGQGTMVNNYIEDRKIRAELCVNQETLPAEITLRGELTSFYSRSGGICLKNIPVFVQQNDEVSELDAEMGDAPHKFRADIGTAWAGERIIISEAYTGFQDYSL